ncbi:MAG: ATP-binding cassette domain-containing protein, partial [Stellaceae bacterium]
MLMTRLKDDRPAAAVADPHVALSDVRLVYGADERRVVAVDRLNLELSRGEFASVVGPSGCGKSTLMKLVTGLLRPTEGTVRVDGARVERPIRNVGMAFQNATLMPWRTTIGNV